MPPERTKLWYLKNLVKITKLTPQGNELILDIFSGGTVFGEMMVLEPRERDESARDRRLRGKAHPDPFTGKDH